MSLLKKLKKSCLKARRAVYLSAKEKRFVKWVKDNGDKTLRLDYDLNENSVVFDLGGYEGQWASDIFARYCCNVHVFEPVPQFFEKIKGRFSMNPKIRVYQFGLSGANSTMQLSIDDDGSSLYGTAGELIDVKLIDACTFFAENAIDFVDLVKINIEGGEYELLEHLITTGFIVNIKNIQVQFHDFVPYAEKRMRNIQALLSKTHYLTYQYELVWENWRKKDQ